MPKKRPLIGPKKKGQKHKSNEEIIRDYKNTTSDPQAISEFILDIGIAARNKTTGKPIKFKHTDYGTAALIYYYLSSTIINKIEHPVDVKRAKDAIQEIFAQEFLAVDEKTQMNILSNRYTDHPPTILKILRDLFRHDIVKINELLWKHNPHNTKEIKEISEFKLDFEGDEEMKEIKDQMEKEEKKEKEEKEEKKEKKQPEELIPPEKLIELPPEVRRDLPPPRSPSPESPPSPLLEEEENLLEENVDIANYFAQFAEPSSDGTYILYPDNVQGRMAALYAAYRGGPRTLPMDRITLFRIFQYMMWRTMPDKLHQYNVDSFFNLSHKLKIYDNRLYKNIQATQVFFNDEKHFMAMARSVLYLVQRAIVQADTWPLEATPNAPTRKWYGMLQKYEGWKKDFKVIAEWARADNLQISKPAPKAPQEPEPEPPIPPDAGRGRGRGGRGRGRGGVRFRGSVTEPTLTDPAGLGVGRGGFDLNPANQNIDIIPPLGLDEKKNKRKREAYEREAEKEQQLQLDNFEEQPVEQPEEGGEEEGEDGGPPTPVPPEPEPPSPEPPQELKQDEILFHTNILTNPCHRLEEMIRNIVCTKSEDPRIAALKYLVGCADKTEKLRAPNGKPPIMVEYFDLQDDERLKRYNKLVDLFNRVNPLKIQEKAKYIKIEDKQEDPQT